MDSLSSWVVSTYNDTYPCMGQRRRCRHREKSKPHGDGAETGVMQTQDEELLEAAEAGGGKEGLSPRKKVSLFTTAPRNIRF